MQPSGVFERAVEALIDAGELSRNGKSLRRIEVDFLESKLESSILDFMHSSEFFDTLNLDRDMTILEKTANTGKAATGRWSQPDFLAATIRSYTYDPQRYLDVIALELKNHSGTDLVAVHEALAHSRFAHFAFLICPRSSLHQHRNDEVRNEAARLGVGLIFFDLGADPSGHPHLFNFEFVVEPERKSTDPLVTDKFIDARFNERNKERLKGIIGG